MAERKKKSSVVCEYGPAHDVDSLSAKEGVKVGDDGLEVAGNEVARDLGQL